MANQLSTFDQISITEEGSCRIQICEINWPKPSLKRR
jgi:hypothetical protein